MSRNRAVLYTTITTLALAALACTCGPLTDITEGLESIATPEIAIPPVEEAIPNQPASGGTMATQIGTTSDGLPIWDTGSVEDVVQTQAMSVGQTVNDSVESTFDAHNWVFEASSGQQITVTVSSTDGSSDPVLHLIDPTGVILLTDLDDSDSGGSESYTFTAATGGQYTARVDFWSSGTYSLSVQ